MQIPAACVAAVRAPSARVCSHGSRRVVRRAGMGKGKPQKGGPVQAFGQERAPDKGVPAAGIRFVKFIHSGRHVGK